MRAVRRCAERNLVARGVAAAGMKLRDALLRQQLLGTVRDRLGRTHRDDFLWASVGQALQSTTLPTLAHFAVAPVEEIVHSHCAINNRGAGYSGLSAIFAAQ